jgi:hypothetical protein
MLTQAEADALIAMRKRFVNPTTIELPPGTSQIHQLIGEDEHEQFLLDLWRGTFRIGKVKLQNRARKVFILGRLDVDGSPHTNPDGTKIGRTHLHVYREGYEDRWAFSLDANLFPNSATIRGAFGDFCDYCHILPPLNFQEELV